MQKKEILKKSELLKIANQSLKNHEQYFDGILATDVIKQAGYLLFKGESFLDKDGLLTTKSTIALNLYKALSVELSKIYDFK